MTRGDARDRGDGGWLRRIGWWEVQDGGGESKRGEEQEEGCLEAAQQVTWGSAAPGAVTARLSQAASSSSFSNGPSPCRADVMTGICGNQIYTRITFH